MGLLANQPSYQKRKGLLANATFYQKPNTPIAKQTSALTSPGGFAAPSMLMGGQTTQQTIAPNGKSFGQNIAAGFGKIAETTAQVAGAVAIRSPLAVALTVEQGLRTPGGLLPQVLPQKQVPNIQPSELDTKNFALGTALLGKDPIEPLQKPFQETKAGLSADGYGKLAGPIAVAGVLGAPLLDIYPPGSLARKTLTKTIVGIRGAADAYKVGRELGLADDLLKTFMEDAPKILKEAEAEKYIANLDKTIRTTKLNTVNVVAKPANPTVVEWPTTALKPSKAGATSIGSAPIGKGGVSAQKADTSVPFDGTRPSTNVIETAPRLANDLAQTTKSTQQLERTVADFVTKVKEIETDLHTTAQTIASKHGAIFLQGPTKTVERITEKLSRDYAGDVTKLADVKDVVRNSVVTEPTKHAAVLDDLKKLQNFQRHKEQKGDTFLGYEGHIVNVKYPNGAIGEIQVITPEMMVAKLLPETSKKALGEAKFNEIVKRTGVEPGRGHVLYEDYQKAIAKGDMQEAARIRQESEAYYAKIKGGTPTGGRPFDDAGREPAFSAAAKVSPEVRGEVQELIKSNPYERVSNKQATELAKDRVAASPDEAARYVLSSDKPDAEHTATGIELIRHLQSQKKFAEAADIADALGDKLVKSGQHIQAAKLLERLSPEGVLMSAQKIVAKINKELKIKGKADIKLEPEFAEKLYDLAKLREDTLDPLLKEELSWEIGSMLASLKKVTIGEKFSTAQTIAQLLNPKTLVRNILGNELFYRVERLNKYIATPIDWTRSTLTGSDRTISLYKDQGHYWSNFIRGARAGWKGVVPGGLPTQLDIGRQVFKSKYNPLYWGEKMMGASLRGFDFAAYSRAKNQTLGELGYLRAINEGKSASEAKALARRYAREADDNLLQIADDYGKYITFQDDNLISKGLTATKRGLNLGYQFGLGDLVLKYPRTPGALLMRAIEYSPAGFVRSAYLIAAAGNDSREIVLATSRAITGTLGFTGMGYYLADKGIITGKPDEDKETNTFERSVGAGPYRINVSALKRWIASGFKDVEIEEGDITISYDWAQPIAVALSIGANMNEAVDDNNLATLSYATTALESLEGGINTLIEQPLVSGLTRVFGYGDLLGGLSRTAQGTAASFVPTLANQLRQWIDNTKRNTYDPSYLKQAINLAQQKVPYFAQSLNPMVDQFGKDAENFQGNSNNIFNVFFNPAFVSTYATTPEAKLVLDIIESTSDNSAVPRIAPKSIDIEGENRALTADEYENFQRGIGTYTQKAFEVFAKSEPFMDLPDTEKADLMANTLTEATKHVKDDLFDTNSASAVTYKDRLQFLEITALLNQGETAAADAKVAKMGDTEYEAYKSVRSSWRAKNTTTLRNLLNKNPADAVLFVRSQNKREQERLLDVLTDEEYELYEDGK